MMRKRAGRPWRRAACFWRASAGCIAAVSVLALVAGCQQNTAPWASVEPVGLHPQVEATWVDGVLTMPVGTLVPLQIRVYSYGAAAENNTEYKEEQEGGLPIVADDANIAIGGHHSGDIYVVVGGAVGETTLQLQTSEGETIRSFRVRVVDQTP